MKETPRERHERKQLAERSRTKITAKSKDKPCKPHPGWIKQNKISVTSVVELSKQSQPVESFFGISGVYFLLRDSEIVYIGESSCVLTRISQHFQSPEKTFDSFSIERIEGKRKRKNREKFLIKKHCPLLNYVYNSSKIPTKRN